MGNADDPTAVVDESGAVRGVKGLSVIDESIMPDIPSVATNVTTIMIAEAICRRLRAEPRSVESFIKSALESALS